VRTILPVCWMDMASRLWTVSVSSSFASLVSAVGSLSDWSSSMAQAEAARSLKGDAVAILATLKGPADCRGCENPEKIWRWWDDWLRIQDLLTKQPGVSCDIKAYGSPHSASRIAINTRFA